MNIHSLENLSYIHLRKELLDPLEYILSWFLIVDVMSSCQMLETQVFRYCVLWLMVSKTLSSHWRILRLPYDFLCIFYASKMGSVTANLSNLWSIKRRESGLSWWQHLIFYNQCTYANHLLLVAINSSFSFFTILVPPFLGTTWSGLTQWWRHATCYTRIKLCLVGRSQIG